MTHTNKTEVKPSITHCLGCGRISKRSSYKYGYCDTTPACRVLYRQTPKYKEYQKSYNQKLGVKARHKKYYQENKEHIKAYNQTPRVKAHKKLYNQTPKAKAYQKAYHQKRRKTQEHKP